MAKLQVSAKMKIREGMLEAFKQHAVECVQRAKEKDPGTLQYDWFISTDKSECEIRETYKSSEAFLAHLSNLGDLLSILYERFASDHTVAIYGEPLTRTIGKDKS